MGTKQKTTRCDVPLSGLVSLDKSPSATPTPPPEHELYVAAQGREMTIKPTQYAAEGNILKKIIRNSLVPFHKTGTSLKSQCDA